MAEGGYDPTTENENENENPWLDWDIGHDDDDDDEEEVNTTRPFQPGPRTSTSYQSGKQHETSTFPREQSGLPEDRIPFLDPKTILEEKEKYYNRVRAQIKRRFPRALLSKIKLKMVREKGNEERIYAEGNRQKGGFHSAWPHRLDRWLSLQRGWTSYLLSW